MSGCEGPARPGEAAAPNSDFLVNEYEALWRYIIHLDGQRRDAVRLLFAALPGIPAAAYGLASGWHGRPLSAADVAGWMVPLLLVLGLLGLCYFWIMVKMRIAAVDYTRKLNLTRRYLLQPFPSYTKDLSALAPGYLDEREPDYVGKGGTDYWYRVLVALLASAAVGTAAYLIAAGWCGAWYWAAAAIGAVTGLANAMLTTCLSSRHLGRRSRAEP